MKKLLLLGIVILMFASLGSAALTTDLLSCYTYDVNGSDDFGSNDQDTFTDVTHTDNGSGKSNGYYYKTGDGDWGISDGNFVGFNEAEWTTSVWINIDNEDFAAEIQIPYGRIYRTVTTYYNSGTNKFATSLSSDNANWDIAVDGLSDVVVIEDGEWYHFVLRFNTTHYNLFFKGENVYTLASTTNIFAVTGFYWGSYANANYLLGGFDDTAFWTRALTDSEILELNGTSGTPAVYCPTFAEAAPSPSNTINLSSPFPTDNSQFNTELLNFNVTANNSNQMNCSVYINETLNQTTNEYAAGTNTAVDFDVAFDVEEVGNFTYVIGCWDGTNDTNTSTNVFYIDNVDPVVDQEDISNSHQELTLTYSINISDIYLYSFQMNDSCGNGYLNTSTNHLLYFDGSYRIDSCTIGLQQTNITVCDGNGGALNCISETYLWNKTSVVNITAFNAITGISIDSFTINDSEKSISTTNGNITFWQYEAGDYLLTIDSAAYATSSETVTFGATTGTHPFTLWTTNSFNFTFYDELTENIINQNVSVEFISDVASYNFTAENGTLYADVITPGTYTIRYSSSSPTDYGLIREYIYILTNNTHNELSLWMVDNSNSTAVTITVYDETSLNLIENAIVYIQRYFIEGNVYRTVAMYSTDVAGKSYFDVEADNQYHKILIDYPFGTRKYTSEKFYFSGTAYNVYVSLIEKIAEDFFDEEGIGVNIIYTNSTSTFTATWTDSEAIATRYCLYLKKYGQYSKETLNYSCSTANSGSIELTGFATDTTNYAIFTATINGEERIIASSWKQLVSSRLGSGSFGVFMTAVLVGIFSFMVSFHIISLILGAAALIFAKMIGILEIGWPYVFGIFFAAVILALLLRLWKR